ncbi:MAG: WD40 repeat domain-containing protein [Chitinophagaceae bacterium]
MMKSAFVITFIYFFTLHNSNLKLAFKRNETISANTIVFSPDSTRLLLSLQNKTAIIIDVATGKSLLILNGHTDEVNTANYSPDGKFIITASKDKTTKIWNAITGTLIHDLKDEKYNTSTATFSPDGKRFLIVAGNSIKIYDSENATLLYTFADPSGNVFTDACFGRDNRSVYSGSTDNTVKKWVIGFDQSVLTFQKLPGMVTSVSVSPVGNYLVAASILDKMIYIYNTDRGTKLCSIPDQTMPQKLKFSNDGNYFLAVTGSVTVSSFKECKEIYELFDEEEFIINAAAFNPSGNNIATVSSLGTIKLWDAHTGKLLNVVN